MTDLIPDDVCPKNRDLREYTDQLRHKHAIVKNINHEWVLLKHADVVIAALDHDSFSSNVSRYLQIPNGLDGEEHSQFRQIIDGYLTHEALLPYIVTFEETAEELMQGLPKNKTLDAVTDIGAVFAVRAQCAWLGWPKALEPDLLAWMKENHAATRSGDKTSMANVAAQFDNIIRSVIEPRRKKTYQGNDDVTSQLCREKINGRQISDAELISILRNWTGGDLGSIALCVGVIIAFLANNPDITNKLRTAGNDEIDKIINEILRLDDPFVNNRRITTCPVNIAGHNIPRGEIVKLNWTSANRDEKVFEKGKFDPENNASNNLVYGIGKHVCPGRLLATWELRIAVKALLANVQSIKCSDEQDFQREVAPVGGYNRVPIIID